MTDIKRKWIAGSGIALFLALSLLVFWFAGKPMLRFVSEPERFRQWVDERGIWGQAAFLGMVILQVFVAVIPGEPLEIAAGYAFGFLEGTLLCLLGMTIGGIMVFAFVRRFGVKAVEVFIPREKILSMRFLKNQRRIYGFFLLVFLLPGTPKDVLSYCAGLTNMTFFQWLLLTSLCRLPSIVTSTIGGNALGTGELLQAVAIFCGTLLLSLTGLAIYKRLCNAKDKS